jgi:hypothetical protein
MILLLGDCPVAVCKRKPIWLALACKTCGCICLNLSGRQIPHWLNIIPGGTGHDDDVQDSNNLKNDFTSVTCVIRP